MKDSYKSLCQALVAIAAGQWLVASPTAAANPYSGIGERNSFGLSRPPDPPTQTTNTPPSLTQVKVTGITTVMGVPRALIKLKIPANLLGRTPPREASYILVPGEPPIDGIEVLEIRDHSELEKVRVTVRLHGKQYVLPLSSETAMQEKLQAVR